jgi:hypothetical protein
MMKKEDKENKRLDEFEQKLFEATKVSDREIEEIVSGSELFSSVMAKIESAEEQKSIIPERSSLFGFVWLRGFLTLRRGAVAVGALGALLLANIIWMNFETPKPIAGVKSDTKTSSPRKTEPEDKNRGDLVTDADYLAKDDFLSNDNSGLEKGKTKDRGMATKVSFKKQQRHPKRKSSPPPARRKTATTDHQKSAPKTKEEQKIFYQLPFTENGETRAENLEIVRAELSRSELFALGVNLQLENHDSIIKTELLVGADGIVRAIRVVEKF